MNNIICVAANKLHAKKENLNKMAASTGTKNDTPPAKSGGK